MIDFNNYALASFDVSYEDIINCDIRTVSEALNWLLESRQSVLAGRGKIALSFSGYDDDARDVWDIPEIRRYVAALDATFPYWFYFLDLRMSTLGVLGLCLCRVMKVGAAVTPNMEDLRDFVNEHLAALYRLCEMFELGEATKTSITNEILEYLVPSR
jgi:hypothetical protein